jgi:proteasome alpha subunit
MSMPFYVSPEQLMKDRADFARKGISRGRSLVVVQYADGIVFVSENLSQALHKVSEIYDRIAFAAVGRYNEFENLRIAGVRLADMRGYAYDRQDVTGRGLANAYAQTLGTIFSSGGEKPYEVELFVAEVGDTVEGDSIYRLTYDGQVADEHDYAVMGGSAEQPTAYLKEHFTPGADLDTVIRLAVKALGQGETETREVPAANLEVAVLDRTRVQQRKFKRLTAGTLRRISGDGQGGPPDPGTAPGGGAPGPSSDPTGPDDPRDPTDTVSDVPPLEDPVTGEPNPAAPDPVAPDPVAPPVAPPVSGDGPVNPAD